MKRKILATLLSLSLVAVIATGCGKKEEPVASLEPEETTTVEMETPEESEEEESDEVDEVEDVAVGLADPEDLPAEAAYHFTFDGEEEGYITVIQTEDVGDNTGANLGVEESDTNKDGEAISLEYVTGPVGNALSLDGSYGIKLPIDALETEEFTISFWMNADRLSNYGPTLQLGSNIGMNDEENTVTWINFTQTDWGANSAKIFPVVWNRNSETGTWPWVYAADDEIHGKREWILVTLVATGDIYTYEEDGLERNACQLYLNGELVFDAEPGTYGGLATGIMDASDNFECFFGINYWDSIYKGFIDDLYIYKEALSAGQVASLYLLGDATVESAAADPSDDEEEKAAQVVTKIDDSAIAVVGAPTCDTGWWSSFSDSYEVPEGGSVTITFNNYGSGIENWHNYVFALTNTETTADKIPSPDNYDGYAEFGVVRADAFGWAFPNDLPDTIEGSWGDDWDGFVEAMMDAKVTLTISRDGADVTVDGKIEAASGASYTYEVKSATAAEEDDTMYVFITGESCYIEILSVK